jgi:hydrogenase-4 transcriptional activator
MPDTQQAGYDIPDPVTENLSSPSELADPPAVAMEKFTQLLLGVWREACKHIELGQSVQRIAPLLRRRMPVHAVIVRRIDVARSALETVAADIPGPAAPPEHVRTSLSEQQMQQLLGWCRAGAIKRIGPRARRDQFPPVVPEGLGGDVVIGPLLTDEGPSGILIVVSSPPKLFDDEHLTVARALLEPFAAAMENDRRLHEVTVLREAAEADKRSLLTRLGRQDIADTIVGVEAGFREVMERVELVAASDVPVLLLGETGSGKEVAARAIHNRSRRAAAPFLRVNCGAIPAELIDSELFGHERGSFTGAQATRQGWFERADAGTLFLDEVGELTPAAQVRLLRVLQDGTFERVGGQRQLHADVRIIAATHRDLQAMVADGRFRQDLWYRVAVFPVRIPPLRERRADIPALATHFALKAARRFGVSPISPSPAEISTLISYPWPGNVRELASVLERAVIIGNGRSLEVAKALGIMPTPQTRPATNQDLPGPALIAAAPAASTPAPAAQDGATLSAAMADHIRGTLRQCRGRIEGPFGAAARLGINPHTLRARMRKLGIDWAAFRAGAAGRQDSRPAEQPSG